MKLNKLSVQAEGRWEAALSRVLVPVLDSFTIRGRGLIVVLNLEEVKLRQVDYVRVPNRDTWFRILGFENARSSGPIGVSLSRVQGNESIGFYVRLHTPMGFQEARGKDRG